MRHLFTLMCVINPFWLIAQSSNEILVQGESSTYVMPDVVHIRIMLTTKSHSSLLAIQELRSEYVNMLAYLTANGIENDEVMTQSFDIAKETSNYLERTTDSLYQASHTLKLDISYSGENLSRLADVLSKCTLQMEFSSSFSLSDVKTREIKNLLLKKAIEDARSKAAIIASGSGVKLGGVKTVSCSFDEFRADDMILYDASFDLKIQQELPPPMQAEKIQLTEQVRVVFSIR